MRQILIAVLVALGVIGTAGASDMRHDQKLAMAAARIAAERMGELRGGFAPDGGADFVAIDATQDAQPAPRRTGPRPGEWVNGLAIAVERPVSVSPDL